MAFLGTQGTNGIFHRINGGVFAMFNPNHVPQPTQRHVKNLAPIGVTKSDAINLNPSISGCVAPLSFGGCPANIAGFIISIIVNAIKGVLSGWSVTHISKEIQKISIPFLTQFNSSTPISRIFVAFRVIASLLYVAPNLMFGTMAKTMKIASRQPIGLKDFGSCFTGKTAATRCSFADIGGGCYNGSTAVTTTLPHCIARIWNLCSTKDYKATMALTGNIKGFWHLPSPLEQRTYGVCGIEVNG